MRLRVALMAGIGARGGEAALEVVPELAVVDGAGKASVASTEEAMVPALLGHPDLEADDGVGGWVQDAADAAECGQSLEGGAVGGSEGSCGDRLGRQDGGVGQGELGECVAVCGLRGGREGGDGEKDCG